jgi:hypothetical protein
MNKAFYLVCNLCDQWFGQNLISNERIGAEALFSTKITNDKSGFPSFDQKLSEVLM